LAYDLEKHSEFKISINKNINIKPKLAACQTSKFQNASSRLQQEKTETYANFADYRNSLQQQTAETGCTEPHKQFAAANCRYSLQLQIPLCNRLLEQSVVPDCIFRGTLQGQGRGKLQGQGRIQKQGHIHENRGKLQERAADFSLQGHISQTGAYYIKEGLIQAAVG
jgi:hypothetical protein